jgi:DNA replication protein DnaC
MSPTTTTVQDPPATSTGTAGPGRQGRMPLPEVDPLDALIDEACRVLRLPTIRSRYEELAVDARRDGFSYSQFLADLLQVECADRDLRRKIRMVRDAKFPRQKRVEDFEYDKNPNVSPETVGSLSTDMSWVQQGRPLVMIGDSGTGKSHLLIGIGTAVAEAGLTVRYTTTAALVNELAEAEAGKHLISTLNRYTKVDLLCLDEFGYLNLDKKSAKLLFQIFTEREERKATAVASNAPFGEWNKTFTDPRLCTAVADRLTFKCTLIETGSDSYRLQATEAEHQAEQDQQ